MADIFISYSSKNRSRVRVLADALSTCGWSVWWDRQIPAGRTFDEVIGEALANARCVLVVWSKESIASSWVREEADDGRRRGILIPVLIDEARPPLGFGRIQAVDLADWNGLETAETFQKLVVDIVAILGPPQARGVQNATTVSPPSRVQAALTDQDERQGQEPALPPQDSDDRSRDPSRSIERESDVDGPARVVRRPGKSSEAAQVDADDSTSGHDASGPPRKAFRWSLAAALVLVLVALGVYALKTGASDSSQPPSLTEPSTESGVRLSAVLNEGGDVLKSGVSYAVYEPVTDAEGKRKRVVGSAAYDGPPRFPLPAGRYYVAADYGRARASTEVEVTSATVTIQTLNLRAGILNLSSVLAAGSPPLATGVSYVVEETVKDAEGNRERVVGSAAYEGPPRFPVPAGRYHVTAVYGSASASKEIEVKAGEIKSERLDLQAGILNLASILAAGSPPIATGVSYVVEEAAKDAEGNRRRVVGSAGYEGPPRFPLRAGRYYVTAVYGSASASTDVEVKAGEIKSQRLDLQAGILNLSSIMAAGSPPLATGVSYVVEDTVNDAEGKRKRVVGSAAYEGPPRFPLPAGRYHVAAAYGSVSASREIEVKAGEIKSEGLDLQAGILQLSSILTTGSEPLATGVSYVVYEAVKDGEGNRKRVVGSAAYDGPPRFPLPAGRYFVTAASDAGNGSAEIAVAKGAVQRLQLRLSR